MKTHKLPRAGAEALKTPSRPPFRRRPRGAAPAAFLALFLFCGARFHMAAQDQFASAPSSVSPDKIRVYGSVSVAVPVLEAAKILREEQNLDIDLGTNGGSPAGIAALGRGTIDAALSTKPVSAEERAAAPEVLFSEIKIGRQAMAMVVSRDVWEGGVHALTKEQILNIYEGKITNWKAVGGPDLPVKVFMSEPGRGLWEMFAQWLYGEVKKAPFRTYPTLSTYSDLCNALEFTRGSITDIPPGCADNRSSYALAIRDADGTDVTPEEKYYSTGKYPLCRDMLIVVNDRPTLKLKTFVEFMLSDRGQALLKKAYLLPLEKNVEQRR